MRTTAWGMGLLSLFAASVASAAPTMKLLRSPVAAGELVKVQVHLDAELNAPLHGVAASGGLGPFTKVAPLTYEAEYSPPKGVGPSLVALAAYEDAPGGLILSTLVNVVDVVSVEAKVKTHEPVFARAGSTRYGPFHAEHGKVTLRFAANGEVTEADLETAQGKPLGKVAIKPNVISSVAFARPERLRAGDTRPAEVILLTTYDRALKFEPPKAVASAGKVALDVQGSPEVGLRYVVTPPPQLSDSLVVKLSDSFGKPVAQVSFTPAGPAVAKIDLKAPDKALHPGEKLLLDVTLLDATGKGAEGELALEADSGKLSAPLPLGPGLYNVTYTAPAKIPADGIGHITAKVVDSGATQRIEVQLRGGAPAKVVFDKPTEPARAGEVVNVPVTVLDEAGNPADADDLQIAADHGDVAGVTHQSGNHFVVQVKPQSDASSLMLTARNGKTGLEGQSDFSVEPAATLPFALLGPEGGYASNLGQVSSPTLAVTGQFLVGPRTTMPLSLSAGFMVGFLPAPSDSTLDAVGGASSGTGKLSGVSRTQLLARLGGFYALGDLGLFGGLGGGTEHVAGTFAPDGATSASAAAIDLSAWVPAAQIYGGAGYKLGPGYVSLEVRRTFAKLDKTGTAMNGQPAPEVSGGIGSLDGVLGYLFTF